MKTRQQITSFHLLLIGLLLLVQLFIRIHNAEIQEVFVDEGYHVTRGAMVWDFDQHPGRFSQGKLLLYFWLGFFETDPMIALPISRMSIGMFSLINGAALFILGRTLHSIRMGIIALAIYAVLPFAFFFERMVLADPFAAAFMSLTAWRSLIFAKRPTWKEGVILGVLVALATLAKLTMALIPFLPAIASFIYLPDWRAWLKIYFPRLVVAACVCVLLWLPVLIPAAFAASSDAPFIIVNPENLQQIAASDPGQKAGDILPELMAYTTSWVMIGTGVMVGYFILNDKTRRMGLFFFAWLVMLTFLSIIVAKVVRARYLMPISSPMVLIIGYSIVHFWQKSPRWLRVGITLVAAAWVFAFALPFAYTASTNPNDLPLGQGEWNRYMSGTLSGDALREAAATLNHYIEPESNPVYSTWGTCQLLHFYVETDVTCLPIYVNMEKSLGENFKRDLHAGDTAYVVLNGVQALTTMEGYRWKFVAGYKRPNIDRPVEVWRIEKIG